MIFRTPTADDKPLLDAYLLEHTEHGERKVPGVSGYRTMDFPEWLEMIKTASAIGNEFGRSELFLCFEGGVLVGLMSVRYDMPAPLLEMYGNIGYNVRPSERRKGYATEMLRFGLAFCREKGLDNAVLGCYRDNIASAKTIEKCGGILSRETAPDSEGRVCLYYDIPL